MFTITEQAKQYIHAHGGHVIITLTFEPSGGSCWKGDLIWGSYVPEIGLGKPGQQMDYPIMGPLSRPRSKILRVAVSRIILSSEASKVKLVGNLVA